MPSLPASHCPGPFLERLAKLIQMAKGSHVVLASKWQECLDRFAPQAWTGFLMIDNPKWNFFGH